MSRKFRDKRGFHIMWQILVGATFLSCSLLIYHYLTQRDIPCSTKSECSKQNEYKTEKLQTEDCGKVCTTKECLDISNHILSKMDENADPCHDFYTFACGKFKEKYEGSGNRSIMSSIADNLYPKLRYIIETSKEPPKSAMHKVKIVYDSCMNTASSEINAIQDISDFLSSIGIPDWPHLNENFEFISSSLPEVIGKLNTYREFVFFHFEASPQSNNASKRNGELRKLSFKPAPIMFHEDSEDRASDDIENAIVSVLSHIGLDFNTSYKMRDDFIAIENQILEMLMNISEIMDENCMEEIELLNCNKENPSYLNMLCRVLESVVQNGKLASRYSKDEIEMNCFHKLFVAGVYNIVETYSDRDIVNYMALKVLIHNLKNLNFSIRKKWESFFEVENHDDFSASLNKVKHCIYWIANNMQFPLGVMYTEKMLPNEASEQVNDMMQEFINVTADLLLQQKWIGESKEEIAEKVSSIKNCLHSVVEAMRNRKKINSMYKMFKPSRKSFIRNVFMHKKNYFTQSLLNEEYKKLFSKYGTFTVNAYSGENVYLTLGILNAPHFHPGYPNLLNIAGTGQTIGHEIGHLIFNYFEDSPDVDEKTRENFKEKTECIINQYSSFELKKIEKNVQGNQTVSEDFPDNMSLKVVEKVAKKYFQNVKNRGIVLPGISYSPEELLYITYAQSWCAVRDVEKETLFYDGDSHSPPEFRITGTLQNSIKFSEVFNCSATSYMNLQKKCIVFE